MQTAHSVVCCRSEARGQPVGHLHVDNALRWIENRRKITAKADRIRQVLGDLVCGDQRHAGELPSHKPATLDPEGAKFSQMLRRERIRLERNRIENHASLTSIEEELRKEHACPCTDISNRERP